MRSPRERCPWCGSRRVLYDAGEMSGESLGRLCAECGRIVSMARAYIHLGLIVRILHDPDFTAQIEAKSKAFADVIRAATE